MKPLRVGVVGVGSLGQHHARILANLPGVQLAGIIDSNQQQAETIANKHQCKIFPTLESLKTEVDAVSIVTPTKYHSSSSLDFLASGIPCLIEKPLASTVEEAKLIVNTAKKTGTLLQVGHIERFNPGFSMVETTSLRPRYIEAQRLAPFSGRGLDVGVVFDLMIHDIDLVLSLVRSPVKYVDALGVSVFGIHEDLANARLHFANGCIATLTASRVHPQAVRTMNLFGVEGYAGIDFTKKSTTLMQPTHLFRSGQLNVRRLDPLSMTKFKESLFGQHLQSKQITHESTSDQLTAELTDFVKAIRAGRQPKVTGEDGLAAVEVAHQILKVMACHDWNGNDELHGPTTLPLSNGSLFVPESNDLALKRAA